jgi:hypothetical protein
MGTLRGRSVGIGSLAATLYTGPSPGEVAEWLKALAC